MGSLSDVLGNGGVWVLGYALVVAPHSWLVKSEGSFSNLTGLLHLAQAGCVLGLYIALQRSYSNASKTVKDGKLQGGGRPAGGSSSQASHSCTCMLDSADRPGLNLCDAAARIDVDRIRKLVAAGVDVNACNHEGRTALHVAASLGDEGLVNALLSLGAEVKVWDDNGNTPWHNAIRKRHTGVSETLTKAAGLFGGEVPAEEALFLWAVRDGALKQVEAMLKKGQTVHCCDENLRTPMHLAASRGDKALLQLLVEHGAAVNPRNRWGATPWHEAVQARHEEMCEELLALGADVLAIYAADGSLAARQRSRSRQPSTERAPSEAPSSGETHEPPGAEGQSTGSLTTRERKTLMQSPPRSPRGISPPGRMLGATRRSNRSVADLFFEQELQECLLSDEGDGSRHGSPETASNAGAQARDSARAVPGPGPHVASRWSEQQRDGSPGHDRAGARQSIPPKLTQLNSVSKMTDSFKMKQGLLYTGRATLDAALPTRPPCCPAAVLSA